MEKTRNVLNKTYHNVSMPPKNKWTQPNVVLKRIDKDPLSPMQEIGATIAE